MGKYTAQVQDRLILPARVHLTRRAEQEIRLLGRTVPPALAVRLIVDTGSGKSTLVPSVISYLKPFPGPTVRMETSLARTVTSLFWIRLEFPGTALESIPELAVARVVLAPSLRSFDGVVGRDLLFRWEYLLFKGRRRSFTIRDRPRWLFGRLWH